MISRIYFRTSQRCGAPFVKSYGSTRVEFTLEEYLETMERRVTDSQRTLEIKIQSSQDSLERRVFDSHAAFKSDILREQMSGRDSLKYELTAHLGELLINTETQLYSKYQKLADSIKQTQDIAVETSATNNTAIRKELVEAQKDSEKKLSSAQLILKNDIFDVLKNLEKRWESDLAAELSSAQKSADEKFSVAQAVLKKELMDFQKIGENRVIGAQAELKRELSESQKTIEGRLLGAQVDLKKELNESLHATENRLQAAQLEVVKEMSEDQKVVEGRLFTTQAELKKELLDNLKSSERRMDDNIRKSIASNNFALVSTILAGVSGLLLLFDTFGGQIVTPWKRIK